MVMERKCTDMLICLIFFVFFLGMFATAAYGYHFGDPQKLLMAFDSDGNACGSKSSTVFANYPYLYWPDLTNSAMTAASSGSMSISATMLGNTVCVKQCPGIMTASQCKPNSKYPTCPTSYIGNDQCKYSEDKSCGRGRRELKGYSHFSACMHASLIIFKHNGSLNGYK